MAYIERAYLTEQFENLLHDDNVMNPIMKVLDALEIIDTAPTADVAEVKHGKWLIDGRCSECLENPLTTHKSYCPNCGAKMDGQ